MSFELIPLWECIWVVYGIISMLVHCIVLFTILKARRSNNSFFRGPFFTIVLIQGFHELVEFLSVNLLNRFRKYRIIEYEVSTDNNIVEWEYYFFAFMKNIIYMSHLEIALNRLSAFLVKGVTAYDRIWNTTTILLITLFTYIISGILRAIFYSPSLQTKTMFYNDSLTFIFDISGNVLALDSSVDMIVSSSSAILSALCYIWTAVLTRRNRIDNIKSRKQEILLLKCGMATFFILLPSPIRSAIEIWGAYTNHLDVKTFAARINLIPAEAMCVFQPWLLLISCASLRERIWGNISRYEESSATNHDRKVQATVHSVTTVSHA